MSLVYNKIQKAISDHQFVVADFSEDCWQTIKIIVEDSIDCIENGGKIIFFGNGGSAADSQHLATELMIRFSRNRAAIPSLALTTDTSLLTACANDFSSDLIFSRQIEGLCTRHDFVVGISTSGNSKNVELGLESARAKMAKTCLFTGRSKGVCSSYSDIVLNIPSSNTARIQECHILAGHIICDLIEEHFEKKWKSGVK